LEIENQLDEAIKYYGEHPIEFCEDLIGVELDDWQKNVVRDLLEHRFVAIRSGSGVGKTCLLSLVSLWFLVTHPFSKVPSTAPSQHQLHDLLWSEHYKWIKRSSYLDNLLDWTQTRVEVKGFGPEWYAVARTARVTPSSEVVEGLQGFHCLRKDSEILTDSGWKFVSDIDIRKDKILTKNPETNEAFYESPSAMFKGFYQGEMYHSIHQNLDFCVTPNHKIPYRSETRKGLSEMKIEEIQNINYSRWHVEDTFKWVGNDAKTFELPSYTSHNTFRFSKELDAELWFCFLGLFMAEGHCRKDGLRVMIAQKSIENTSIIVRLIQKLGFECHVAAPRDDIFVISIYSAQLGKHLKSFGSLATNKRLPSYVRDASPRLIKAFLNGYCLGDGTINKNGARVFFTSSRELAGNIQELIFKIGRKGSMLRYKVPDSIIRGKLVTNCADRYVVTEYVRTNPVVICSKVNLEKVYYEGDVYCPTMPTHHLFFMRRNGCCMWSGNSSDNLLFLVDEASGVPDAVYPAIEGALTAENSYVVLASNPTRRYGYFFDIFNKPGLGKFFKLHHVSCYDSSRVASRYIEWMEELYGKEHPVFQIKVLGDFPASDDEGPLIPYAFIDMMMNNSKPRQADTLLIEIGVDVGRTSSPSILCVRQGYIVLEFADLQKRGQISDTDDVIDWIETRILDYKPSIVRIDAIGIGAGVYDGLRTRYGDLIIPIVGSGSPVGEEAKLRYLNLRAQAYWGLRELIPYLWCIRWPDRAIVELGSIRGGITRQGKSKIESKKEMLSRAMRSPDYADAMMYAFMDEEIFSKAELPFSFASRFADINDSFVTSSLWYSESESDLGAKSKWKI